MPTKTQSEGIPPESTTTEIASIVGIPMATVRDLLAGAGYPVTGKHSTREGLRTLFRAERERKGKQTPAAANAAQQKAIDEAAMVAMDRATQEGSLILKSDFETLYADAIARATTAISRLTGISKAQKEAVFAAIRNIPPPELKIDDED